MGSLGEQVCVGGRAHVVLVPSAPPGHTVPFFFFARKLASRGVKVTILSAEFHVSQIQNSATYKEQRPVIRGKDIELVGVKDGILDGSMSGFIGFLHLSAQEKLVTAFAGPLSLLMSSSTSPPPCCIVSDMMAGWTQVLAAKFNIPRYVLHTQSAANLSLMLHVPTLIAEGRLPLTKSNQTEVIKIPGVKPPLRTSELPSDLQPGAFISFSYELFLRTSSRAAEAPIVLINTFRELEDDVLATLDSLHLHSANKVPRVIPIGPLLPRAAFSKVESEVESEDVEGNEHNLMQWLDKQPPRSVVYISFGTAGKLNFHLEQVGEMARGLEASEQGFVWVDAQEALGNLNSTSLSEFLPPGFEERTKERGKLVNFWAPQLRILNHPACGAFLSHCGWNSILEGIAAGVPLLTWPQRAEQKMNNRFMVDTAKVAVEFNTGTNGLVMREEIERVIRLTMQQEDGQVLRSRIAALKSAAASNAFSTSNLDTFLAEMSDVHAYTRNEFTVRT